MTQCQNEDTRQIVMSFSPPAVGCFLRWLTKGWGVTGSPGPPPPSYAPDFRYLWHNGKHPRIISLQKQGLRFKVSQSEEVCNPLARAVACEYFRLSFAPTHVVAGANERQLYSQATRAPSLRIHPWASGTSP